jgi:hypothetical protein
VTYSPAVFANPYLRCALCQGRVTGRAGGRNQPCGHREDFYSACESWSPAGGCLCLDVFGERDHPVAAGPGRPES